MKKIYKYRVARLITSEAERLQYMQQQLQREAARRRPRKARLLSPAEIEELLPPPIEVIPPQTETGEPQIEVAQQTPSLDQLSLRSLNEASEELFGVKNIDQFLSFFK